MPVTSTSSVQALSEAEGLEGVLTRTEYRHLARHAKALGATLTAEELAQPEQALGALAKELRRLVPSASEEQALRALRKAVRKRTGEEAPRGGSPPNFSLKLEVRQLKFLRERAPEYGSQAAVVREALDRLMDEQGRNAFSESDEADALAEAQVAGVDLEHLRHNLTLTPAQRLARLQAGIRMMHTLRSAQRL